MPYTPSLSDIPATAPQSSSGQALGSYTPSLSDIPQAPETSFASKALAATGAVTQGVLHGAGKTLEAVPNLTGAIVQKGLNLLNYAGLVSDDVPAKFQKDRDAAREYVENMGQKVLDFQGAPSAEDRKANPTISKIGNVAGDLVGSTAVAGGLVGKLGKGLDPTLGGAVNMGAQGALVGASANDKSPIAGAAIGGAIGIPLGAAAGKFGRSADIINDKIDDAQRIGLNPYSTAGLGSIKGALDNGGKELTTEALQRQTKGAVQATLDKAAPASADLSKNPADMIVNAAKGNFDPANPGPYSVFNTKTGALASEQDTVDAWTKVNRLLIAKKPNLGDMTRVANTLGPEGKQLFGYGYLQQAVNNAMTVEGRILPTNLTVSLNKLQNSGLADKILTPELKDAFEGMRRIAEGAVKTTARMDIKQSGMVMNFVNKVAHSSGGITLLRALGAKTTPVAVAKNIISQMLVTDVEKHAVGALQQQGQK